MGRQFYAPSGFNLSNVVAAGSAGGKLNIFAMNRAVGHFGTFDYQRAGTPSSFTFYKGLTPASNMDVGAVAGGATSYGVRYSITGETGGPSSLLDFSGLTKLTNPFRSGNSILGNLRGAFAKGPDLLGGGAAIAGGAGYRKGGC